MNTTICFFDLDNTLLDNDAGAVPDSALKGLSALRDRGTRIVISTGRDMDTHYSVRYKDIIRPDAIIHQNGTRITVGDEDIFVHYMDTDFLREIFEFCREQGISVGTSIGDEDFYLFPRQKTMTDLSYKPSSVRHFVPYEELFKRGLRVSALSMAGDYNEMKPVVEGRFPSLSLYSFPKGLGADVVEKEYSKAEGLKRITDYYHADIADTYAFGDAANDIPILKAAGTGIAMGNADSLTKAAADYVTDTVDRDGIYKALKYFDLI